MSYDTPHVDNNETQQFSKEELKKLKEDLQRDVMYRPVPYSAPSGSSDRPVWRMRFELVADRSVAFGLDVNGEVLFGRDSDNKTSVDLTRYGAEGQGVSRRHLKLRPTDTKLFVVDLGSTNGTWLNGVNIGVNTPFSISNGDTLSVGSLQFVVAIVHRPLVLHDVHAKADLADVLEQMAKAIVSQLELDEVLSRALEMALTVVEAEEAAILLADKQTGELFVEAERRAGSDKTDSRRRKIEDPLAAKVIRTGEPLKASSRMDETQIRIREDMLVDALSYVPIKLGGVSFGVLLVTHRQEGKKFTQRDQRLLGAITDFAAIALQNSRLYQSTRAADQLKDEMIQNISHEFRTPLSFILGFTEFVLEDAKEEDGFSENQIDYLRLALKHAHKLEWLVDNFVTIQSAQDIAPNKEPTGVVTLLDDALESVRFRADELNITVVLKVGNDMPLVMIDRMAISQVVDNLLSNALKFTPRGGEIGVHAALMPSGKVHISIVNTGMGVPDEERERIFEKFVQVDGTTTRSFGGVGIGLAVCKAVIDSHKEKIWVESESGKGATFIFSLPRV